MIIYKILCDFIIIFNQNNFYREIINRNKSTFNAFHHTVKRICKKILYVIIHKLVRQNLKLNYDLLTFLCLGCCKSVKKPMYCVQFTENFVCLRYRPTLRFDFPYLHIHECRKSKRSVVLLCRQNFVCPKLTVIFKLYHGTREEFISLTNHSHVNQPLL